MTTGAAIAGGVVLFRRRTSMFPLLVPIVLVTVMAAIFYGVPRFRAPAEPSLAVLAAVAVVALWDWVRAVRQEDESGAAGSSTMAASSSS